jgi:carbon monoxide dehydrogenase subunit G
MLNSQASAATSTSLLDAVSAANTAAATSGSAKWLDVRPYDGEILVTLNVGAVTGTIAGKLQTATDANGTGAADLTGGAFAATVANSCVKLAVDPKAVTGGFLGFVGTIVTGPSLVSVVASGKKKIV